MSASAPLHRSPSGLRLASAQELLAAFRVDAQEFLRLFIAGLQTQPTREDTLQSLGNAAEALRGIRIGADFLRLQDVSALCRRGEQDLLRQLPLIASGAALQWGELQAVIDGLRDRLMLNQGEQAAAVAAPLPPPSPYSVETQTSSETQPEPEPEPEIAPSSQPPPLAGEAFSSMSLSVQTATVGPWVVALPLEAVSTASESAMPWWRGPDGQLLLLHDDMALPALDLAACWNVPNPRHTAGGAAMLLQSGPEGTHFAVRVQALGRQQDLLFWPVPPAVQSACGVRAAAWEGAPWQPQAGQAVLLLDLPWLAERLRTGEGA
ncbi:MAG: histidine kinase [Thiomonas sp.]|uniref:histidine kinase n=1 Tax=Thiomonas sp. TaxID=2047785 RepID=UPI002A359668|nr:histidine kinase [Thiomonas sp.]MDY0331375.1 histidine kinase [Thiomonas sp.]